MNGYLLDTNVPSELIRTAPDSHVDSWVRAQDGASLYLSVITIGEFRKGLELCPESKRRRQLQDWLEQDLLSVFSGRVLPVTQAIAERWGEISGRQQTIGRQISMADGLIAATALEHGLTVVTRNLKDFSGVGVTLLDPWTAST